MSINSALLLIFVLGMALTFVCGNVWWKSASIELGARLDRSKQPLIPKEFLPTELSSLPLPVQRYLSIALPGGNQLVEEVTIQQTGEFNQNEINPAWKPFTAIHRASTRRPGFIWDARIRLFPGITLRVRDAYVAGEGILRAALFGLFRVAHLQDSGELAKGELMRYLAEMAWYPTAFLPSQGVSWEAVDQHSARATLSDGPLNVSLLFRFNASGMIDSFRSNTRAHTDASRTIDLPWEGRFWNYVLQDGLQVPLEGEVTWIHPDGAKPYWRGKMTQFKYEFAQ